MRHWLFALAPLALVLVAHGARAQEAPPGDAASLAQAKVRFEAGRSAYLAGDYGRAVGEFQAAQAIRPSPILDYNIGLAFEGLGDGARAVDAYRRYLTLKPDAQNRPDVEARIAGLQQQAAPPQNWQQQPGGRGQPVQPPPGNRGGAYYDPYGANAGYYPPAQPYSPPPVKRHSRWWIPLVVIGGVVTLVVIVVVVAASTPSYTAYEQSPSLTMPRLAMPQLGLPATQPGIPAEAPALLRF